ncbi:MAG: response regulator [Pirellulaceae bacterium]
MKTTKHCRIELENDTVVVTPMSSLGELDCDVLSADMGGVVSILQQQRARHVVIDFRHTEFFCSEAIYLLLKIHRSSKERHGRMALCGLSAHQREVLSLMALDKLWPLCDSQPEALEFVGRHALNILIVDDSEVDRCLAGGLLEPHPDYRVAYATTGREALTHMSHHLPDVIVSDLVMPELNGLELVGHVRQSYPLVPVILLTAHGNEAIAFEALELGAASYVPKSRQAERLVETVDRVAARVHAQRVCRRLQECPANMDCTFHLGTDPALIRPTVDLIQHNLSAIGTGDAIDQMRIGIALEEAMYNALYHGNLEITAEELDAARAGGSARAVSDLLRQRLERQELRNRRIVVDAKITSHTARFVIRDEGQGFDHTRIVRAATDCFGDGWNRGTMLMCTLMDEITYNATGNEVTLVKVP